MATFMNEARGLSGGMLDLLGPPVPHAAPRGADALLAAVGPAGIGRDRAGRGRDPVHLPGRGVRGGPRGPGLAEIIVGKQRNGPIGEVRLTFTPHLTRFDNHAAGDAR